MDENQAGAACHDAAATADTDSHQHYSHLQPLTGGHCLETPAEPHLFSQIVWLCWHDAVAACDSHPNEQ